MFSIILLLLALAFAVAGLAFFLREAKRKKADKAKRQQRPE